MIHLIDRVFSLKQTDEEERDVYRVLTNAKSHGARVLKNMVEIRQPILRERDIVVVFGGDNPSRNTTNISSRRK